VDSSYFLNKFNRRVKEIDRSVWGTITQIKDKPLYDIYKRSLPIHTNVRVYVGLTEENACKKIERLPIIKTNKRINGIPLYYFFESIKQGDPISVHTNLDKRIIR